MTPQSEPVRRISPLDPGVLRARLTGRSWWVLRYVGGTIVPEWSCDWLDAPSKGRQALRLYCPNGQCAELGLPGGGEAQGRFVQLKVAVAAVGAGQSTLAHLIGLIDGLDGEMQCAVWDYRTRTLRTFRDNATHMVFENIGPLSAAHLGAAFDR